jgi:hypothetical protein
MQPLPTQFEISPLIGRSSSMIMMRVRDCSRNGLGKVTRNSFLDSPLGSISAAATTG